MGPGKASKGRGELKVKDLGRKGPRTWQGIPLRKWGEIAGLPGKVCVWCSDSLAGCLGLDSEATLPGHEF